MQRALVIGQSGGIGRAVSHELVARGVAVTGLSRSTNGIDLTDEASVAQALSALIGPFDLIFVATGALHIQGAAPEKALKQVTPQALCDQFMLNAVGPMLVLKHGVQLLPRRTPAVFAALSARVGSIGDNRLGGWYSYRAAKAALNQLIHGAAIELARSHKHLACLCLHPGTVQTAFAQNYTDRHPAVAPDEAARRLVDVVQNATPVQTGQFLDYAGREIPW